MRIGRAALAWLSGGLVLAPPRPVGTSTISRPGAAVRPGLGLARPRARGSEPGRRHLPALALVRPAAGRGRAEGAAAGLGIAQILAEGRLHGTPTINLHGCSDALVAPNHCSRAYYGLNALRERPAARSRYYEVTNAQHLDAFNSLPGYSTRFVPLHDHFVEALDLMWAHLTKGAALPPSQVVATTPRTDATPITAANVPPIAGDPGTRAIVFSGNVLRMPD